MRRDRCSARDKDHVRERFADVAQDIGFAVRTLRRRPAFAATALLTLALGIGATTAMFTVVDGVLLQPLPYRDPSRLVSIYTTFPHWKGQPVVGSIWNTLRTPYPDYMNLIKSQRSFEGVAGFMLSNASLGLGDKSISIHEGYGTANLLPLLGVKPSLGRWFLPGEDGPAALHLALLSHELWQARFGGDSAILGRSVHVDEEAYTVIGVMPPGFSLSGKLVERPGASFRGRVVSVRRVVRNAYRGNHTMELIGRLRPGVSITAALADAEPLLRGERRPERRGATLVARAVEETKEVQRPLLLLFASVGVLLLITCGNIALLFLSECVVREPEMRTRAVLGAGRSRLVRLLLTESAVIAAIGAIAGGALGWWGTRIMIALAPTELPHAEMVGVNVRVALFAMAVAAVVALISGAAPALSLTRPDAKRGSRSRVAGGRSRVQTAVIGLQACLSVVLMAGAGLLARSLVNERRVDPGFRYERRLTLRVELPSLFNRTASDRVRGYDIVAAALQALPGVVRVASAMHVPLSGRTNGQAVSVPPAVKLGSAGSAEAEHAIVSANYFEVLHIPLIAGRAFTAQDRDSVPPVGIVSEASPRRFWPGETAIGKQFRSPNGVVTVVGIVGNVKNKTLSRDARFSSTRPQTQERSRMSFIVETRRDPPDLASAAERAVWAAVPGATVSEVSSLDALMDRRPRTGAIPGAHRRNLRRTCAAHHSGRTRRAHGAWRCAPLARVVHTHGARRDTLGGP
jgi:predicted permease